MMNLSLWMRINHKQKGVEWMNDLKTLLSLVKQILEKDVDATNSDKVPTWKFSDTIPQKRH